MIIVAVTISQAMTGYGSPRLKLVDEVEAHAVEREDGLRHDGATEEGAEVAARRWSRAG